MKKQEFNEYSAHLDRMMPFSVYGESGIPFIVFPAQNGKYFDFESFGMVDCIKDYIESGKVQLFCVQSIDEETWSAQGDENERIDLHEQWFAYVCEELVDRIHKINGTNQKVMTTGVSMGGLHSVNFFLRRPDIFGGCLSLSGLFHASYFFKDYQNPTIYFNSPTDYLPHLDPNHPNIEQYRNSQIIVCCGQGAWEDEARADAQILKEQFERLNVPAWIDFWGYDVAHDWPWWLKQFPYFMEKLV